jgi:hypothetical protein
VHSASGRNRQEMGEDGGLLAVGQIGNDEAIAGERPEVEDIGAGLYVGNERIGVGVEVSLATVTPSLVMRGAPYDLSRTTLRPFGPSVTFTALLRISTPRSIRSRASEEKRTSLADMMFNQRDD